MVVTIMMAETVNPDGKYCSGRCRWRYSWRRREYYCDLLFPKRKLPLDTTGKPLRHTECVEGEKLAKKLKVKK